MGGVGRSVEPQSVSEHRVETEKPEPKLDPPVHGRWTQTPAGCADLRRASGISDSTFHSSSHRHRTSALPPKITIQTAARDCWSLAWSLLPSPPASFDSQRCAARRFPPTRVEKLVWVSIKGDRHGDRHRLE